MRARSPSLSRPDMDIGPSPRYLDFGAFHSPMQLLRSFQMRVLHAAPNVHPNADPRLDVRMRSRSRQLQSLPGAARTYPLRALDPDEMPFPRLKIRAGLVHRRTCPQFRYALPFAALARARTPGAASIEISGVATDTLSEKVMLSSAYGLSQSFKFVVGARRGPFQARAMSRRPPRLTPATLSEFNPGSRMRT
ncbi:hypothetical protein C8R44DRAFT_891863 [Mycena epipterygia]|nr:hypothetical protein C8R44DRAFT_891863 [Mycena epipterygia]